MKSRKPQLEAIINRAKKELWKIQDRENVATAKAYVGRCFKYRNCYSCPEKESDYWYLYGIVTSAEGNQLVMTTFATTSRNERILKQDDQWNVTTASGLNDGWQEIKPLEFFYAFARFQLKAQTIYDALYLDIVRTSK